MAFMQRQVVRGNFYEVSANHGETHVVPVDASGLVDTYGQLSDYIEGTVDDPDEPAEVKSGWLARLSAPGYMDCTDWTAFDTEAEAEAYLTETYGDDDEAEDDE